MFVFIDIWFVKQDIIKWLKTMISSFLWRIWKWTEKGQKIFDLQERGFDPRFSVIFPSTIWIFMEGEGDEIKSKQASKRDRTFKRGIKWKQLFWESSLDSKVAVILFPLWNVPGSFANQNTVWWSTWPLRCIVNGYIHILPWTRGETIWSQLYFFKRFTLCVKAGAFWQKLHFFQYSWSQIRFKIFTQLTVHTVHMVRYHMQRQEK